TLGRTTLRIAAMHIVWFTVTVPREISYRVTKSTGRILHQELTVELGYCDVTITSRWRRTRLRYPCHGVCLNGLCPGDISPSRVRLVVERRRKSRSSAPEDIERMKVGVVRNLHLALHVRNRVSMTLAIRTAG